MTRSPIEHTAVRQPWLHDRVLALTAASVWVSPTGGQLTGGVDGLYVADRRALSRLEARVCGEAPEPIAGGVRSASHARFVGVARGLGDASPDPTVTCVRDRAATPDGGVEKITIRNGARRKITAELSVAVASDLAVIADVKSGRSAADRRPARTDTGLIWSDPATDVTVRLDADPAGAWRAETGALVWNAELGPGQSFEASLTVTVGQSGSPGFRPRPPSRRAPWRDQPMAARAADRRLDELIRQSAMDLDGLLLGDPDQPEDMYCAAGAPWYMTLFGRDSLWAARMSLPLGVELAGGTLRALARRQGRRLDVRTGEAPGKIPHELRSSDAAVWLPETYYGTVDATPLFVATLADAWRWGLPEAEVAALAPAAERALGWLAAAGDPDGDGFIEYAADEAGLSNQGWKDSRDGVQWADGRVAEAPLALCEVQAYAHQAARDGADLLDAFGRPGAQRWRDWAATLAERFRAAFWLTDAHGRHPAVALDRDKQPVDGVTSNIGHLLGTGLLSPEEEAAVASRLSAPNMDSGYGLRTLADTARGFNPLSYHVGSVWPHDTAIAAWGLARAGCPAAASQLIGGLLAAAPHLGYRLPELYGGQPREGWFPPTPYPAACRPQAWAAAAGPLIVRALLGLEPDMPNRRVALRPIAPSPVGEWRVTGLRIGGQALDVHVHADGRAEVLRAPDGVEVVAG